VCTLPDRDGALTGRVRRTLGFRAEPAEATSTAELPLQIQLISGPMDPATRTCSDPIDASDPLHPVFVDRALVSAPIGLNVTIPGSATAADAGPREQDGAVASDAGTPNPDAGSSPDAAASDAGASICCCDFRVSDTQWHCTHSGRDGAGVLCSVPWPDCCSAEYTVCE
jgi:hypothetical protein